MVSNVYPMCNKCNVHLCETHLQTYHGQGDDNISHSYTIDDEIGEIYQIFKANFYSILDPT